MREVAEKLNNIKKNNFVVFIIVLYLAIMNVSFAQISDKNYKNSISSLKQELNSEVSDSLHKLTLYKSLSIAYRKVSPDSSMYYARQSLQVAKYLKDEQEKADALHNLGVAYFYVNDFKTSLDYLYQSLEIREKTADYNKIGTSLNSIGNVYYNLNNVSEALDFYKRSLALTRKSANSKMEASILNNMGSLYGSNGRIDTAYILLNQSVRLLEKLDDSLGLSSSYNNLALLYRENGAYRESLEYDNKALYINKKMGRKWDVSYISNSIGETYLLMKNYENAYTHFNDALIEAEALEAQDILLFSYRSMTKYYSAVGNHEQFATYFQKYEAIKDAIFTTQNTNSIAEMQVKYETEHKEKENALQKLQIAKERSLRNSFIYISILVLIIVVILLFRFRAKKKLNLELETLVKIRTKDLLVNQSKLTEAQRIGKSGSWDWDLTQNQFNWSNELPIILDCTNQTINFATILRSTHPDDRSKLLKIFRKKFNSFNNHIVFDFRLMTNGEVKKHISVYGEVSEDKKGNITLVQGTIQDITERKLAEQALRESEQLYKKLISASPDAVFEINTDGVIVFASQQSKLLFKLQDTEDMSGTHITDWIIKSDQSRMTENIKSQFKKVSEGDPHFLLVKKDGSTFPGELKTAIIYDTEGNTKGLIAVVRNITDRKQFEQRILRNTIETEERERQRFSEDLHDGLGPLLSAAKIHLELIANRMEKPSEQMKFIKMTDDLLYESIKSTREIANNLTPNLLNDFGIIEALTVYVAKINKMNTLFIDLYVAENFQGLPKQTEVALYRVICELINNSLKHASASKICIQLLEEEKDIEITYSDNGIGFDIQKMLSTPAKGLGLSNIISRVKSINGNCTFNSELGKHFSAIIHLPSNQKNEKELTQTSPQHDKNN